MYHVIALYKNTYYYFGCACNHGAAVGMWDVYKKQFPKIDVLHLRNHPLKDMLEYVKDFKTYDNFYETYRGDREKESITIWMDECLETPIS